MSYIVNVHGSTQPPQQHKVILNHQDHTISLTLDEQPLILDRRQFMSLLHSLHGNQASHQNVLIGGRSYDIFARRLSPPTEREYVRYEITVNGETFEVTAVDERLHLLENLTGNVSDTNSIRFQAPMPGLVLHIPIEVGTNVKQGETLIVLEAMKMENDLSAPIAGTVTEILVRPGQTVDQGAILLVLTGNS